MQGSVRIMMKHRCLGAFGNKGSDQGVRRGNTSMEVLLLLPIIVILVLALVQFALYFAASQRVDEAASRVGRIAARGGIRTEIDNAARHILGDKAFQAATINTTNAQCRSGCCEDMIEVHISVPARTLVPNLLGFIGIDLTEKKLNGRTIIVRE